MTQGLDVVDSSAEPLLMTQYEFRGGLAGRWGGAAWSLAPQSVHVRRCGSGAVRSVSMQVLYTSGSKM